MCQCVINYLLVQVNIVTLPTSRVQALRDLSGCKSKLYEMCLSEYIHAWVYIVYSLYVVLCFFDFT